MQLSQQNYKLNRLLTELSERSDARSRQMTKPETEGVLHILFVSGLVNIYP